MFENSQCRTNQSNFYRLPFLFAVPPQRPRLEHEGVHVPPGHNVTVDSGAMATVKCVSHYGNPPAQLKWFLGKHFIRLNLALSTSVSEIFLAVFFLFRCFDRFQTMHPARAVVSAANICRIRLHRFHAKPKAMPLTWHCDFPKLKSFPNLLHHMQRIFVNKLKI